MTFADEAERAGLDLVRSAPPPDPPKRRYRFRGLVPGRFGKGGRPRDAWVLIDKELVFHVRPYKGRRAYSMPLAMVAAWTVQRLAMGEARKRRAARRTRRAR